MSAAAAIIGAGMAASQAAGKKGGWVGTLLDPLGIFKDTQREDQMALNEQAARLNYEYGEKAAENQYNRQLAMYTRSYEDQSYKAMRKQVEDAGLSVGLMYGNSGSGGQGGATSGVPMGATGGAVAGQAPSQAQRSAATMEAMAMGLQLTKARSEIKVNESIAEKNEADAAAARENAGLMTEKKITEQQSRDTFIEEMKQRGLETWLKNIAEKYKRENNLTNQENVVEVVKNKVYGETSISSTSTWSEQNAAEVAKAWAEAHKDESAVETNEALAKLNNEKAKGYWTELANATTEANAKAVEAAAKKLAAEFGTGEYTNWKTWANLMTNIIGTAAKVL